MKQMTAFEFLVMKQLTPEEIGLELETLLRFLKFYDDEKVINALHKLYGDKLILWVLMDRLGEARVVKEIAQVIGEERLRQIIEQLLPKRSNNNDD
ncbi:hypothetical protein FJZ31_08400 [Candidatus Poribacteria bacterium]|nr:hypothetical protein [Candidatus Poribacteria bacterium]